MGQAASKAGATLSKVAPRITQHTRATAEAPLKPGEYNPTRGHGPDAPDLGTMQEMPPDLIKFLQSSGPLHRTFDKERTSPKVYESLILDEKAREEQAKKANERVRRRMPILGGETAGDDGAVDDGSMTMRTTNFSTTDRASAFEGFGLNSRALFDLALKLSGANRKDDLWKNRVRDEFNLLVSKEINPTNASGRSEQQLADDLALLENTMRYISIPVLMRDVDGDIVGTWSHKVEDLKFSGMRVSREKSLHFVLLDEVKET
ncbi:hypothetical protein HJC23_013224 [Cyclotella cryptica]|uniref:Uncharacterized protein n=1 Tax=Cyclotella cryptica TaxID=29204 RepID=A0ABD3P3P2_9STRA|eukprot:CCRYP_017960-RB/>CCRYP_017960-RB protein AED:0.01 eAED:0.01 QI:23/1/1/1/0.5/0.33/3/3232/261